MKLVLSSTAVNARLQFLIYISDVEKSGETVFDRKGYMDEKFRYDANNSDHLVVKPKRGRVLV